MQKKRSPLLFVCMTEKCFEQGLLCFHCGSQEHAGDNHDINTLDQLKEKAADAAYDNSTSQAASSQVPLLKEARLKCIANLSDARRRISDVISESERSINIKFDELERYMTMQVNPLKSVLPEQTLLESNQPTADLNRKAITFVRELIMYDKQHAQTANINKDTIAVVQKCAKQCTNDFLKLSQQVQERLREQLSPIDTILTKIYETNLEFAKSKQPELKTADEYFRRGVQNNKTGNKENAIYDFNQAIKYNPSSAEIYYNRGIVHSNMGQHTKALEDYNQAIYLNSSFADAYNNRGLLQFKMGNFNNALLDYNHSLWVMPDNADTYYNRAIVYTSIGNKQKALDDYNNAIRLDPKDAALCNNRAILYKTMGDLKRALQDYNESIRLNPTHAIKNRAVLLKEIQKTK